MIASSHATFHIFTTLHCLRYIVHFLTENGITYCWISSHGAKERAQVCIGVFLGWEERHWGLAEGCCKSKVIHLETDDWRLYQVHPQQHLLLLWPGTWYNGDAWCCSSKIWLEWRWNWVWHLLLYGKRQCHSACYGDDQVVWHQLVSSHLLSAYNFNYFLMLHYIMFHTYVTWCSHFIVPELGPDMKFSYASHKAVTEYKEAKAVGDSVLPLYYLLITGFLS